MSDLGSGKVERRAFETLGGGDFGWLNGHHHFVVGRDPYDATRLHWGALRVLNDDIVQPGGGFPPHSHRNMEIISYVLEESFHPATKRLEGGVGISHNDDTGSSAIIQPGDVQVMTAGSDGITHSEFHPGGLQTVNFLQIWLLPTKSKDVSSWGTRHFPRADMSGKFVILASGFKDDQPGALSIHTDSRVAGAAIEQGCSVSYSLGSERLGYVVVAKGHVEINGVRLYPHDGAAIKETDVITVTSVSGPAEVLLVDTVES